MKVGEIVKILRKKNNISQIELADELDVSQSYLSKIEKNVREPSMDVLKKMAGFFIDKIRH